MATQVIDFSVYKARRATLIELLKKERAGDSVVMLSANIEGHDLFVQDSSFYYFTGLQEPGLVCLLYSDGKQLLCVPNCMTERLKWSKCAIGLDQKNASTLGFDTIMPLGKELSSYQLFPFSTKEAYEAVVHAIEKSLADKACTFFSTLPSAPYGYMHQRLLLMRLQEWIPGLKERVVDCSSVIARMRQTKTADEIDAVFRAIQITRDAQHAAANAIVQGAYESEVQAALEYVMTAHGAKKAFPSIVASGPNSTVLHYTDNNRAMQQGDLVVVDIGASYKQYAADITRTYPVGGVFSPRQKEVYEIVLATQEYIASIAAPGYYLKNAQYPEKSLHHLAKKYLDERGYGDYMPHGIGHYLGLDVHDVGDYTIPLKQGDLFTVEPGIYIAQEQLGIRIEDDYWMTDKGAICLSEDIPKTIKEVEQAAQQQFK